MCAPFSDMTPKQEHERRIFEAFLKAAPEFSGEPLKAWWQPQDEKDFPDIQGRTVSGRHVGVELGEWLNQTEMQAAKAKERLEASVLDVIGPQGTNTTEHIHYVWLRPKPRARIKRSDAVGFRAQLLFCIHEMDARWPKEPYWNSPPGHQLVNEGLAPYPLLAKYQHTCCRSVTSDQGRAVLLSEQ